MRKLIRLTSAGPALVENDWTITTRAQWDAGDSTLNAALNEIPNANLIVPLSVWQEKNEALRASARASVGVWLDSHEDPAALANDVSKLALIAVNFPTFKDGRGYSTAALLRQRYGFRGELRAIGEVLRDQLFYLKRVGFDAFELPADAHVQEAFAAFTDFSDVYQGAVDQPLPFFARRFADAAKLEAA